ncbi:MAG: T9SS type A sorting domain-containing protein [Cyclobacteriaceae bacterium]|nr:T9SS type A sorting domain-containing protein [Cyclobacteriaceae bacterium]
MPRLISIRSGTKKALLTFSLVGLSMCGFAQAVFNNTGSWEDDTRWLGNNIGDDISEDVQIIASRVALINNGSDYTIGNLTFGNSSGLTINSAGALNVGADGTPKNVTAGNFTAITVTGTLIIWGDLVVLNSLSLNVSGTLIIKGNIQMANTASISVTGNVDVEGDFTGGDNTNVTISSGGHINVDGSVDVGEDSNLTGPPGSFTAGNCSQGTGSNFCNGGVLPVDLLFFRAVARVDRVDLVWATASELNADYFEVEKSDDGLTYSLLARESAMGNSTERIDYQVTDEKPRPGKTYYRLRQADIDGKVVTFDVVLVDFNGLLNASVYPNPARNGTDLTIELNFKPKHPVEIVLLDLSGHQLERLMTTKELVKLPLQLDAGMYLVRVTSPEYKGMNKFLVSQ